MHFLYQKLTAYQEFQITSTFILDMIFLNRYHCTRDIGCY